MQEIFKSNFIITIGSIRLNYETQGTILKYLSSPEVSTYVLYIKTDFITSEEGDLTDFKQKQTICIRCTEWTLRLWHNQCNRKILMAATT